MKNTVDHVVTVDGHDFASLLAARDACAPVIDARSAPVAIIANTVKGNGVSYLQDTVASHYQPMSAAQYEQALVEVTRAHAAAVSGLSNAG